LFLLYLLEGKANIKKVHFTIKVTSFFSVYMQKSWKLCYVKAIYKRVRTRISNGTAQTEENVKYDNRTLTMMLRQFTKY